MDSGHSHSYNISVTGGSSTDTFPTDIDLEWMKSPNLYVVQSCCVDAFTDVYVDPNLLKKENTMLEKLVDMVFALNLSEADVEEFKKIIGKDNWRVAVDTYLLAKAVKNGLTADALGYEEED